MLDMFGGFGELGIFGDTLGPIIAEKEKKAAKKKEPVPATSSKKYKGPVKILFDSMEMLEINDPIEFTEEELFSQK